MPAKDLFFATKASTDPNIIIYYYGVTTVVNDQHLFLMWHCNMMVVTMTLLLLLATFILVSIVNNPHQQDQQQSAILFTTSQSSSPLRRQHDGNATTKEEEEDLAAVYHCSNDLDCNLNGICQHHACVCDMAWGGTNCSILRLLPTSINSGYRPLDRSSWGASVFYSEKDAKYHMIAAEMANGCGLTSWQSNSYTIHATSTHIDGPYTKTNHDILGLWSHNPTVTRHQVDGSLLLMVAGYGTHNGVPPQQCVPSGCCVNGTSPCGMNPLHGCNSTSPPWPNPKPSHKRNPMGAYTNFSMYVSPNGSPEGPWYQKWRNVTSFPSHNTTTPLKTHQWTPAIWSMENGTIVLLLMGGGLFSSSTNAIEGPYHPWGLSQTSSDMYWGCSKESEDPFLYQDSRGNWHCIVHQGPFADLVHAGGHTFSNDHGTTWYKTPTSIYRGDYLDELLVVHTNHNNHTHNNHTTTPKSSNIQRTIIAKRERPHLVFDHHQGKNTIIALTTGVCVGNKYGQCNANSWPGYHDKTFTHVQKVATTLEEVSWWESLYSTDSGTTSHSQDVVTRTTTTRSSTVHPPPLLPT